jgi:transposase-like protein
MSQKIPLPTDDEINKATTEMLAEAQAAGRRPSVQALARRLGLTNTTFWRHYPHLARQISDQRRATPTPTTEPTNRIAQMEKQLADLRRANQDLTDHLHLAVANIQRLTLDNHQLRQELHAATNVRQLRTPPTK